jgi:TonB-linked SusC/RagA family outer membrane protein
MIRNQLHNDEYRKPAWLPRVFLFVWMACLVPLIGAAQALNVSGVIKDETNNTLPGVSITIKGTTVGTVSDTRGYYSLKTTNGNAVLVFSYIGYETLEKPIGGLSTINVMLQSKSNGLNEVVVVGYGTVKKGDLTGAVAQVKMTDLEKAPVKSFDDALAGRLAGVTVTANDGQPGTVNNIVIRGAGSVTQDNSPLYVVDGFPLEDGANNSINPSDIASIDVLKDASSTAIYGARGANGVIIITTKKGKNGPPVISYDGYYGIQKNHTTQALMSPYEYVRYQQEINPANVAALYFNNGQTLNSYRDMAGLNLQDQVYQTGSSQSHSLAMRGGNDKTRYAISGNVLNQQGVIINSGFKRYQGRISVDQNVNTHLKVGANVNYSNSVSSGTIVGQAPANSSVTVSLLYAVWGYRPVSGNGQAIDDELFDPAIDANLNSDYRVNPIISAQNELRRATVNNLIANAYAEYQIVPDLTLRVSGGITNNMLRNDAFNNSQTSSGNSRNVNGVNGSVYYTPVNTWLNENTLTYKKAFGKDHVLDVLGGYTMQGNTSGTNGYFAINVPNESLGLDGLDESPSITATSISSRWGLASFLGRINYTYKSKYLLTGSFRSDGSSKFARGHQWGYFPSGAFAWRMSNEDFMKNLTFISDAKLRLSYGATGNNRVGDFAYLSQINFPASSVYSYNNGTPLKGTTLAAIGNPNLKWETTRQTNIGYDLSLFRDRIGLTVDWYRKTTHDLLLNATLPYTTGIGSAFKNVGTMQNQGLEFTLNTVNIKTKTFSWGSNFNISLNKNKVLALTENQTSLKSSVNFSSGWNDNPAYIAVVGQPVAQMYGLLWDGVYQYADFDKTPQGKYVLKDNITTNGNDRSIIQPGDVKYKDINGDGVVNSSDFTIIGRGLPVHTGGFTNNFTYKGFDLNVFFQWSYGNDLINANRLIFEGNGNANRNLNQFASYADRWEPDNPSNTLFRAGGQGPTYFSSRVIEDGSYLRLKTVSLGYNLPAKYVKGLNMRSARIYVSGQNLYTWTNYSGPDPEVSVRNSTLTPGFDYSAYPNPRTIVFGLNVSF